MFEPGKQKTGGRKKGSKNKKTPPISVESAPLVDGEVVLKAESVMASQDFNPTLEMIKLFRDPDTSKSMKIDLLLQLNALINPKAKASAAPEDPEKPATPKPGEPPKRPNLALISNGRLTELLKNDDNS